jgi:peptidoglycan/LPS O-acetylase OafA/YrhL
MQTGAKIADSLSSGAMPAISHRIVGLDSIRFLCALIVMLGHYGLQAHEPHLHHAPAAMQALVGIYNCLFNGPAAVIVFFVISGFCIHFPMRHGKPLAVAPYYTRRMLRILPPAVVFFLVLRYVLHDTIALKETSLWSVLCETTYYLLYPGLLWVRRRLNWQVPIGTAATAAAVAFFIGRSQLGYGDNDYIAFGNLTWIVGLPCWLLGCWLAEVYTHIGVCSPRQMWSMRAGIFWLSVALQLFRFHGSLPWASNIFLLDLFTLPVLLWIGLEIRYATEHPPRPLLEWAGTWSYSLYLVHMLTPGLLQLGIFAPLLRLTQSAHLLLFVWALVLSYLFYRVIELPSHRTALRVSRWIADTSKASAVSHAATS